MGNSVNVVAHNLQAVFSNRQLGIVNGRKDKTTEKLASGYRINRSADDAAGLAISEKMRRQIRGLTQGTRNTQDGISLLQVADGALSEVNEMLHRITELSIQSANGTNTHEEREYIQHEISEIIGEIDQISNTEFNHVRVFGGGIRRDGVNPGSVDGPGEPGDPGSTGEVTDIVADISYIQNSFAVTGTPSGITNGTKTITADSSGIKIDGNSFSWSDFRNGSVSLDPASTSAGSYSLDYSGLSFSISVKEGMNADTLAKALNGASFKVSSRTDEVYPASASNITVSKGTGTDRLLAYCVPINQDSEVNNTKLFADESGITLKAYDITTRDYTENLSTVSWSSIGINNADNAGGDHHFYDPVTGLGFDFSVVNGTSVELLAQSINGAIFDTVYSDGGKLAVSSGAIDKSAEASGAGINLSYLEIKHNTQYGDFYEELGFTSPSQLVGGIDTQVWLGSDDTGKLYVDFRSDSGSHREYYNANKTNDYNNTTLVVFGNAGSNSLASLQVASTKSGKTTNAKLTALNNFLSSNGGEVNLGSIHVKEYFEYKMTPFGKAEAVTYSVSNVKTKPYDPSSDPAEDDGDEPDTGTETEPLSLWIQSGTESGDGRYIYIDKMDSQGLGIRDLDVTTQSGASSSIEKTGKALGRINSLRANIGAQQNRLEHIVKHQENTIENTQRAESQIRDTDMAAEMMNFSAVNIIQQAGQSMLTQANQSNQGVMSLLQ